MDDEEAMVKTRKMTRRDTATVRPIALRITGSLITMVLLLWTIHSGYEIATETQRHTDLEYSQWAFHVGVVTMFFGFSFLALGISVLLDLFLKLSQQLQKREEEDGIHQGSNISV